MNKSSKYETGYAVFVVAFILLLAIILAGGAFYLIKHSNAKSSNASVASSAKTKKDSSSSSEVIQQTQSAYNAYLKIAATKGSADFIQNSGYFTPDFKSLPGGDYDKLLCDQDIVPKSVSVASPKRIGAKVSVSVTKVAPGYSYPSFIVNLTKTNDKWLISSTDCTAFIAQKTKQQ
jgi:hypothetical protein